MMAPTSWQPSDGERLKFLRNASGLDLYKFAHINAISAAQLKLLEDGGDSSLFYSPAIKTGVGRKLLRRLGDKDASGVPEQAPQTAIGPADVLTKSSVAAADSAVRSGTLSNVYFSLSGLWTYTTSWDTTVICHVISLLLKFLGNFIVRL